MSRLRAKDERFAFRRRDLPIQRKAPWSDIPPLSITCIEHPYVVKNISRALDTLGGPSKAKELVGQDSMDTEASLFLRPDDRMCKPIPSSRRKTHNVLLQITLPKRTGRKRKRGSQLPFQDEQIWRSKPRTDQSEVPIEAIRSSPARDVRYLRQGLQDNIDKSKILPLGTIEQTHRFRSMPDFVWSTTTSPFMRKFRETILPLNYKKMKDFKLDLTKGQNVEVDLLPPPTLTHLPIPYNYAYQQNPGLQQVLGDNGQILTINTQEARKISTYLLAADDEDIPNVPSLDTAPFDSLEPDMKRIIHIVRGFLDERPIWTRRALANQLNASDWKQVGRYIFQYTGYMFRSGPWRDALVKFGVDPRTDPKYRIYQTMMFQVDVAGNRIKSKKPGACYGWGGVRRKSRRQDPTSHIFDGISVPKEGKIFQVCDITDPMIKSLLSTTHIRDECELFNDGWYFNGTWAKAKVIMKEKINHISSGKAVPPDSFYAPLLAIPDILDLSTRQQAVFTKTEANTEIMEMASQIRGFAARSIYRFEDRSMYDLGTRLEGELDKDRRMLESIFQLGSGDQDSQDDDLVESSSSSHDTTSQSADELDEFDNDLDEYNNGMNDSEGDNGDDDENDQESDDFEGNEEGDKPRLALLLDRKLPDSSYI